MKRCIAALAVVVLLLSATSRVQATQTALTDLQFLIDNGYTITAGDKLFDNWALGGNDGDLVDASQIYINPLHDGGLDPGPGLRFDVDLGVVDGESLNFDISYRVSVLDPTLRIKDNSLSFTEGDYFVDGADEHASVDISEIVGTASGLNDLGSKNIFAEEDDTTGFDSKLSDSAAFAQQSEVWVTTSISLDALFDFDEAALYGWEVRFSQEPVVTQTVVPEPMTATLGLLGLGALGLATSRRRRIA